MDFRTTLALQGAFEFTSLVFCLRLIFVYCLRLLLLLLLLLLLPLPLPLLLLLLLIIISWRTKVLLNPCGSYGEIVISNSPTAQEFFPFYTYSIVNLWRWRGRSSN